MPISKYNDDGTVDIYNTKTGEVRTGVQVGELGAISPKLVAEYQVGQSPENVLSREQAKVDLTKLHEPTEEEKKEEKGANIVDQLEKTFFGTEGQEPLAFGKEGFGGRLPGVVAGAERSISPGEPGSATERLNTYIRTLESVRPQLAKMAGDSGNIAFAEQLQAGKGLPQATDTPTEAIEIMQSAREKFGLERSPELDKLKEEILAQGGSEEKAVAEKAVGPTGEFEDRGFIEKLFATEGTKSFLKEAPEIVGKGIVATGQNIADVLGGDLEAAVQRSQEFKPQVERVQELDEAAKEEIATKLETVAGVQALKNFLGPKLKEMFGKKTPEISKEFLQSAVKQANAGKQVRDTAIKEAQTAGRKVDGTKIYNSIKQWADDAIPSSTPSEEKGIRALVKKANKFYNGKVINPSTAKARWDTAVQGFKDSGKAGDTIKAGYHRAIRDGVRVELDKATNGAFEEGTKLIHDALQEDKLLSGISKSLKRKEIVEGLKETPSPVGEFAKKTGGRIAQGAAAGLGLAAVAKALGLQFPGAAYPQE